jgi:hypothetical protein
MESSQANIVQRSAPDIEDSTALALPLGSLTVQNLVLRGKARQAVKEYRQEEGLSEEEATEAVRVLKLAISLDARGLSQRFYSLGDMRGKTERQIYSAVGPPQSISHLGDSKLLQWQRTGYHIAISFGHDGLCRGITHEYGG